MIPRPTELLLVEDNPGDARLIREALTECETDMAIWEARDGEAAIALLRGKLRDHAAPQLILLDLNLPKKDGREVLAEIKNDGELSRIPVVILTSSKAEEDIIRTYNIGVNSFITKPVTFEALVKVTRNFGKYWLGVVALPKKQLYGN